MQPLIAASIVVNFTLTVMQILVSNISFKRVTISKRMMLADNIAHNARRVDHHEISTAPNCVASVSNSDLYSSPQRDPVIEAM